MVLLSFLLTSFLYDTLSLYTNAFMELGVGARALGMGNAFVGLADDPTAFYWNPAGLVEVKERSLFGMYSNDLGGLVKTTTFSFVCPLPSYTLGTGLYWIEIPDMLFTDSTESGIEVVDTATIKDFVGYLSYARSFTSIDIGGNVKIIYRSWGITTGYALETDCGILLKIMGLKIGLNIVNVMGSKVYWSDKHATPHYLPLIIKSGCSFQEKVFAGKLTVSLGLDTSPEKKIVQFPSIRTDAYLGIEYWWKEKFAIRVGLNKGAFSGGCGIVYRTLRLDFGFTPSDLGLLKRISGYVVF